MRRFREVHGDEQWQKVWNCRELGARFWRYGVRGFAEIRAVGFWVHGFWGFMIYLLIFGVLRVRKRLVRKRAAKRKTWPLCILLQGILLEGKLRAGI